MKTKRVFTWNSNRVISIILIAFVVWWGYHTTKLPETTMANEPGPKFFPFILLGILLLLAIVLFFLKPKKKAAEEEEVILELPDDVDGEIITEAGAMSREEYEAMKEALQPDEYELRRELILFLLFGATIGLIYLFGFIIGSIVGTTAILVFVGWKLFPRAILFATLLTVIVFYLFKLMQITLPVPRLF